MRIALLLSGHLRGGYHLPKLIGNHQVDIFVSTWATEEPLDIQGSYQVIEIEKEDRNFFLHRFYSERWRDFPGLSGPDTSGNAASMWYKINRSWKMCKGYMDVHNFTYDFVIRCRPDIITPTPIDVSDSKEGTLYLPEWHGKYPTVTKEMMDHLFYGDIIVMEKVCSLYDTIDEYLADMSIPHCGEGFLFKASRCIKIQRFAARYYAQRSGYLEQVI